MIRTCKTCGDTNQDNFYKTTRYNKCKVCIIKAGSLRVKKISSKPKWCKTCGDTNQDNFYKTMSNLKCKACAIKEQINFYNNLSTEDKTNRVKKSLHNSMKIENIFKTRWSQARKRALAVSRDFSITPEFLKELYIKQNGKCFYSKLQMINSPDRIYSVSVERVDSNKGYTVDNVVLVCSIVNSMKRDLNKNEFIKIVKAIAENIS